MTAIRPTRIVVEISGNDVAEAVSPRSARRLADLPVTQFIFVRTDAWSIGACGRFALAAYQLWSDWRVVFEVDGFGKIVDTMTPAEFRDRLDHYLGHAAIAASPSPVTIGLQVLDPPRCQRCGWTAIEDPESVPLDLVVAVACECRFCCEADRQHAIEGEAGIACRQAQAREDFAEASFQDRRRKRALEAAGEALARCERGASS